MQTAKLFRFNTDEVYIHQDEQTGDIILSRKPTDWDSFLAAAQNIDTSDFELIRDKTEHQRDPFEG